MTESHVVVPSVQATVLAHYELVVNPIAANFPRAGFSTGTLSGSPR